MPDLLPDLYKARARAARWYAVCANRLADALERKPGAEPYLLINQCKEAWNSLVEADRSVRAAVMAGDPIDDYHRRDDAEAPDA